MCIDPRPVRSTLPFATISVYTDDTLTFMPHMRITKAANLLGVSDDTLRRWIDAGKIPAVADESGVQVVEGLALARLAQDLAADHTLDAWDDGVGHRSARNHLTGLIVSIKSDPVMSQVELQCGRYRVVSLISTEAVQELGLEPGSVATAVVKATSVSIEGPR